MLNISARCSNIIHKLLLKCVILLICLISPVQAKDESVLQLQRALELVGYDPGPADGYWGKRTASALGQFSVDFEFEHDITSPSKLDAQVFEKLLTTLNNQNETDELGLSHLQVSMTVQDARHLLERTGIGAHPTEVASILGMTRSEAVSEIISRLNGETPILPMPNWVSDESYPDYWLRWDYEEADRSSFRMARDREMSELRDWWINELIATDRPQAERLVLFWHNHFATAYSAVQEETDAIYNQHQTFRRLGHINFRDLVIAILHDPAMLNYLDNDRSREERPNENLARELMELFVLGEGNYDENTVKEVARALTGYGYTRIGKLNFQFDPWNHDFGVKTILGQTGPWKAVDVANILLEQDQAAEFITRKFWSTYVSEFHYNDIEITKIADTFRNSDYDIKTLIRQVLVSKSFWSPEARGTIIKSPIDLLIGSIRSQGINLNGQISLPTQLAALGQNLFEPPNVAGWPGAGDWLTPSRILLRNELLTQLGNLSGEIVKSEFEKTPKNSPTMIPVRTNDTAEMINTSPKSTITIRYAAENFQGPPSFQVSALKTKADGFLELLWVSKVIDAEGGIDTEKFGRVVPSDLQWQEAKVDAPMELTPDEFRISFLNDKCCGVGGSDGGDRNFYVDALKHNENVYPVALGKQSTSCSSANADRQPGRMYCAGHVSLTEHVSPQRIPQSQYTEKKLLIDRVAFDWAEKMRSTDNWVSFNLGLLNARLGEVGSQAMKVGLVRHNNGKDGQRLLLKISERDCFPDCIGQAMPKSAFVNNETGDRELNFVLIGKEGTRERRQWNDLNDKQRAFISSIWISMPELITEAMEGRNWRERDAKEKHDTWVKWLNLATEALPRSRYAKYAADEGWQIESLQSEANSMAMMMSMMSVADRGSLIAGMPGHKASLHRNLISNTKLEAYFLAAEVEENFPDINTAAQLFSHPSYQLK